ncbi:MAG: hypothetical protein NVSMB32_10770 [Actinomycetota bacterium]
MLHGLYLDPATEEAASGLDAVADSQDVALAYPAGLHGSWNAGPGGGAGGRGRGGGGGGGVGGGGGGGGAGGGAVGRWLAGRWLA